MVNGFYILINHLINLFMKLKKIIFLSFFPILTFAQNDSIKIDSLSQEVIVVGTKNTQNQYYKKLASIDEYLNDSPSIGMLRRGGYASEILLNQMNTERSVVTINGMRIFGACTDKMDPVSSYVEISNLDKAEVQSGQGGSQHGATLGGSVDLQLHKKIFGNSSFQLQAQSGYESVNQQKIAGLGMQFYNQKWFLNTHLTYRDAKNYEAGNHQEVLYSGFTKINLATQIGYKIDEFSHIESDIIYDKATDVGYPALTMDVSLAKALIGSISYHYENETSFIKHFETKLYANTIDHRMDDTTRSNILIHMDMPGENETYGMYSMAKFRLGKHQIHSQINGFYNRSYAEMTMYPNNPNELPMFMLTWPDVRTFYSGIYLEDNYKFNSKWYLKSSVQTALHSNTINSDMGFSSLQIFYPDINKTHNRFLKNVATHLIYNTNKWNFSTGLGLGDRAPSVSEGYGFYLFNANDQYDYVGNPHLKNEESWEVNGQIQYKDKALRIKLNSAFFYFNNYILGAMDSSLIPMTLGARGVKIYQTFDWATLFNVGLQWEYNFNKNWLWKSWLQYNKGKITNDNLPFISPFAYKISFQFQQKKWSVQAEASGNAAHTQLSQNLNEMRKPAYFLSNISGTYDLNFSKNTIQINAGIENIFDASYNTYADWNQIMRPGRNFFIHLNWNFR